MNWKEVKSWAKLNGFNIIKSDSGYEWKHDINTDLSGSDKSLSKTVKSIYNVLTDNKFINHQKEYNYTKKDTNIKNDLY